MHYGSDRPTTRMRRDLQVYSCETTIHVYYCRSLWRCCWICFLVLLCGTDTNALIFFIKNKNSKAHRATMIGALVLSCIFLTSYVIYHTLNAEDSKFLGQGFVRYIYFPILISHIVLSSIVLPFVLKTFSFAFQNKFIEHKKWAKFTYPLWLYVAITGVLVYVFMAPYYK